MTPEVSGACALVLSGAALLLGQPNAVLRALGGFLVAFLLLSAASLGADILSAAPVVVRSMVSPALARFLVSASVLACLALMAPRMLARIDPIWAAWSMLAISEISSVVLRGAAFALSDLLSSGIAAIATLTLITIGAKRIFPRRRQIEDYLS